MYWLNFSHFVAFLKKSRVIIFWENKHTTGNLLNSLTVVFLLYQHDGYHGQLRQSSEIHSSVLTNVLEQKQLASCSRETDILFFFKKRRSFVSVFVSYRVFVHQLEIRFVRPFTKVKPLKLTPGPLPPHGHPVSVWNSQLSQLPSFGFC